jgi:hypothetical protein
MPVSRTAIATYGPRVNSSAISFGGPLTFVASIVSCPPRGWEQRAAMGRGLRRDATLHARKEHRRQAGVRYGV